MNRSGRDIVIRARRAASKGEKQDWFNKGHQAWVKGDKRGAFELFLVGAEERDASCQQNVGYFYDEGIGVRRDIGKAAYWYRRSARQGSSSAALNLGIIYRDRHDYLRAKKWFERALKLGESDARGHLLNLSIGKKRKTRTRKAPKKAPRVR